MAVMSPQFFKRHVFDIFEDDPESVSASFCYFFLPHKILSLSFSLSLFPSPRTHSHRLRDHIALCRLKHTLVVIRSHLNNWTTKNSCKPCRCELLLHVHLHVMCGWNRQAWELALNDLQQLKIINTQLTTLGREMRRYVRRCVPRRQLSCAKLTQILPLAWSPPTNVNPPQVCVCVHALNGESARASAYVNKNRQTCFPMLVWSRIVQEADQ